MTTLTVDYTGRFSLRFTEPSTTIAALQLYHQSWKWFFLRFGAITFDHLDFQVAAAWVKAVTSSSLELQFGRVDFPRTSWSTESALALINPRTNERIWSGMYAGLAGASIMYRKNRADSARAMLKLGRYFTWNNTNPKAKFPQEVLERILQYIASHLARAEFQVIVRALSFGHDLAPGTVGSAGAARVGRFLNVIDGIQQNTSTLPMQLAVNCQRVCPNQN
ncbi:hypothetical protein HK102_009579 [Quaeritorhiza haematococci]|nr:hypothetical protein HK102_009579 [Quaeritorhiza haematococci]